LALAEHSNGNMSMLMSFDNDEAIYVIKTANNFNIICKLT